MGKIVIHWKDKDTPPMEIPDATYTGADSAIIKITKGDVQFWFNWSECWYIELSKN